MKQSDRLTRVLERRAQRLRELIETRFGNERGAYKMVADRLDYKEPQLSRWVNNRQAMREDSARYIEQELQLPDLWFDKPAATMDLPRPVGQALTTGENVPQYNAAMESTEPADPIISATERAMRNMDVAARRMVPNLAVSLSKHPDHGDIKP